MKFLKNTLNKIFYLFFYRLIRSYQLFISPLIPARCRYYPTCSEYGRQALSWHGVWHGGALTLKRIGRCHPWGGHGIDFVPLPLYQSQYRYVRLPSDLPLGHRYYIYRDTSSYAIRLRRLLAHPTTPLSLSSS